VSTYNSFNNKHFRQYTENLVHFLLFGIAPYFIFLFCFSLSSLVSLELRENMLRQLPPSMSFLVKLESLDLGSNEIDELVSLLHV